MTNACWLKNDDPYGESYDSSGHICSNYGTSDYVTAIVVFSILGAILLALGIGWIVRYSKRAARFRAFWNQPSTARDVDFIELQTASPYQSPSQAFSPSSPYSPSEPLKRPKYAVPISSSRPLSMSGASTRGSSIYSNDTYQQDSRNSRRGSSFGGGHETGDRSSDGGVESQQRPRIRKSPLSTFGLDEAQDQQRNESGSGSGGEEDNVMLSPRGPTTGQWGESASGGYGNGGLRGEVSTPVQMYHPSSSNTNGPNSSSAALASYGPDHSFDSENENDGYQPQVHNPSSPRASLPSAGDDNTAARHRASAADRMYGGEEDDDTGVYDDDQPIGTFVPPPASSSNRA